MTVKELIEQLQEVENKELTVFIYNNLDEDIHGIESVDFDITDRVDINIE